MSTQLAYIWRLFREISLLHLWLPLVLTLSAETLYGFVIGRLKSGAWSDVSSYWMEHLPTLLVHYLVFLMVFVALLIKRAAVTDVNIEILDDVLPRATSYRAFGMIPIREWFEAPTVEYQLRILEHRARAAFEYHRTLLFFSRIDYLATKANYLDRDHAVSLAKLHRRWNVPLAFLKRQDCVDILGQLSDQELKDLAWFRPILLKRITWLKSALKSSWFPTSLALKQPLRLQAFVVVKNVDGTETLLHFAKDHNTLALKRLSDKAQRAALVRLATLIDATVLDQQGTLLHEFDFGA